MASFLIGGINLKVLSMDQSTTRSGWAVFVNDKYDHSGVVDKHTIKDSEERFKKMYEGIHDLIVTENPDLVVLENTQAQGGNMAVYKLLCQLQGAIMGMCYAKGIKFYVMAPTQWRKILQFSQGPKVKREELKRQSIEYAKIFGIDGSEDRSEAACIGAAYIVNNAEGIDIE